MAPTLALEDPLHDRRFVHIVGWARSLGRAKEYHYLYTANSVLFDVIYHTTAVASHSNMHQAVTRAL